MAYDAFISYSQDEDVRVAIAIQDGLHRLAKRWDDLSSLRVFRDRSNLQLKSLQESLEEALAESRHLIYLACPKAAKSGWVQDELETFLSVKGERSILIVLTKGELVWDSVTGRFKPGDSSAFPDLHKDYFSKEPLFLDLRWASSETDLSLSNPKFLDAVATIAATLKNIPKDKLTGTIVEEQQRLRRNQRINLGFRGAFGFGIGPFLLVLWAMIFGFTSDAVLSERTTSYLFLLTSFPVAGVIGAISCGVGWKGAIGFAFGYLLLLPFYLVASILPYSNVWGDYALLVVITIPGFSIVGIIGATSCSKVPWARRVLPFIWGGLVAVVLWILLRAYLPKGIETPVVSDVWMLSRLVILGKRAIQVAGEIFSERYFTVLIPLVAACILSGFLFGLELANARIKLPLNPRSRSVVPRQWQQFYRNKFFNISLAAILLVAIVAWSYTLSNSYQIEGSASLIKTGVLTLTFAGENKTSWEQDFLSALRCRKALNEHGFHSEATDMSSRIRNGIRLFGNARDLFFDRFVMGGPTETFALIASHFKQLGEPGELDSLLNNGHGAARNTDINSIIEIGRTENRYGHRQSGLKTLQLADSMLQKNDTYGASFLAEAYWESRDTSSATRLLKGISHYVMTADQTRLIGLSDDLFPGSGEAFWGTGVWRDIQKWKADAGKVLLEIVASMCRSAQLSPALSIIKENSRSTSFWHSYPELAKVAAEAGQYDIAFTLLDSSGATNDTEDEANGLIEILEVLKAHPNGSAHLGTVDRLKKLELRARGADKLDRSTGVKLCHAYAVAGEDSVALALAEDLKEEKWTAYRMIASELTDRNRSKCRALLERSWREMYLDNIGSGESPSLDYALAEIARILVDIGDYHKARTIANDQLETCLEILESDKG